LETQNSGSQSIIDKVQFTLDDTKELKTYFNSDLSQTFIQKIIDDTIKFDMDSLIYMMEQSSQTRTIPNPEISTLNDVDESGSFKDIITIMQDEKQLYISGDIHADSVSLTEILKKTGFYNDCNSTKILFLGDYIDRGRNRLNVINLLITLEFLLPKNILILKGNHELYIKDKNGVILSPMQGSNKASYFFTFLNMLSNNEEYKAIFPKHFIQSYADYFDNLPIMALINLSNIKICAVHGGLPRPDLQIQDYYSNYESLTDFLDSEKNDQIGMSLNNGLLWSDPYDGVPEGFRNSSKIRFKFNQAHFTAFCKKYEIDLMLRAHEAHDDGYKTYYNNRLISVFSTGGKDIKGNINKNSAYNLVTPNILQIDNELNCIRSMEILFNDEPIFCEKEISFDEIRAAKDDHENNYISNTIDSVVLPEQNKKLNESKILKITDKFSPFTLKQVKLEDKIIELNYFTFDLYEMYGIDEEFSLNLDIENNLILNNSNTSIYIDRFCINKGESLRFCEGEIRLRSGAVLGFELI